MTQTGAQFHSKPRGLDTYFRPRRILLLCHIQSPPRALKELEIERSITGRGAEVSALLHRCRTTSHPGRQAIAIAGTVDLFHHQQVHGQVSD